MPKFAPVFATGAVAVALIAVAVGFGGTEPATFGAPPSAVAGQEWIHDDEVAVTIERDPADDLDHYWRAEAFDRIDLHGWSLSSTKTTERVPRRLCPRRHGRRCRSDGAPQRPVHRPATDIHRVDDPGTGNPGPGRS